MSSSCCGCVQLCLNLYLNKLAVRNKGISIMNLKHTVRGAMVMFAIAAASAAQTTAPSAGPVPAGAPIQSEAQAAVEAKSLMATSYRLGAGDQLLLRVANAPDLNEKNFRIDTEGFFSAPVVGRIQAVGMTVESLEKEIDSRLRVLYEQPGVSVSVTEYQSQPVSIFGEVASPGVHQLQGKKTLIELLATAGGVRATAGPVVRITRKIENGRIPLPGAADDPTGRFNIAQLRLKPLVNATSPENDIVIQPNDVISVPKAELLYIAGDVTRSGPLPLTEGLTMSIMEALSATGGVTKTADTKKAHILRVVPGSAVRSQVPVDISKIMTGKRSDVDLVAGDILVIPPSNMKKAAQRALEAAIQMGTVIVSSGVISGAL